MSIWDCWLLQHCLWSDPDDREALYDWYASRVGASAAMDPSRLTRVVVSWEAKLGADQASRSQLRDATGRLLFSGPDGKPTIATEGRKWAKRGNAHLYLAPAESDVVQQGNDRTNGGRGYTKKELDKVSVNCPRSRLRGRSR